MTARRDGWGHGFNRRLDLPRSTGRLRFVRASWHPDHHLPPPAFPGARDWLAPSSAWGLEADRQPALAGGEGDSKELDHAHFRGGSSTAIGGQGLQLPSGPWIFHPASRKEPHVKMKNVVTQERRLL